MANSVAIKKGFTVCELVFVLAVIGILGEMVIVNGMGFINRAREQSTLKEMDSIARAAIDYYRSSGNPNDPTNPVLPTWPNPTDLCFTYIDGCVRDPSTGVVTFFSNPFGYAYSIWPGGNNLVKVTTQVPANTSMDTSDGAIVTTQQQGNGSWIVNLYESIPNGGLYADNN